MKIIPAIDIIDGKCVRLTKGDYSTKKIYSSKPVEVAKEFEDSGIQFLHLVDLDGAKAQKIINYKTLEAISSQTNLNVDFGGGVKTNNDIELAFNSGAKQITGGSIAINNPTLFLEWIKKYSSDKIILGADCNNGFISVNGWQEDSSFELFDFLKHYESKSLKSVICTDISKDGMLEGPSIDLYKKIISDTSLKLIASGGVSSMEDLIILKEIGCEGAIIGKALYEGKITLKQLSELC